jgi:hypothetical protein
LCDQRFGDDTTVDKDGAVLIRVHTFRTDVHLRTF